MAEISPPAWMQAGSYPARTDRLGVISAMLSYPGYSADEATPLRALQGVKPSYQNYQLKVRAAATPNMTVIVSAGYVWIDNHDVAGYGAYACVNDSDKTLTIAPAGGAGQYRRDTVVAAVYDAETAGSLSEWRLEVVQGPYAATAGATQRGSLPPNAQILADIAIAPGQTSISSAHITDVRQFSVAAGGVVPVMTGTGPNRPHPGQIIYRASTDTFVYGRGDGTIATLVPRATEWTPITLAGAWAPNGAAGDSVPAARITADGCLELSGQAKGVAVNAGANAAFGTLPAALTAQLTKTVRGIIPTSVAQGYMRITVDASGAISLTNGATALGSGSWVDLAGTRGRIA